MKSDQESTLVPVGATSTPLFVDVTEARRMLGGIGVTKFYALRATGRIRTCKLGTRTLVRSSELLRFAAELAAEGEA